MHEPPGRARALPHMRLHLRVRSRTGEREPTRWLLLVMEYMGGGELFDRIKEKRHFSEREAALVTKQIASAIAHLHKHDIAHRYGAATACYRGMS